MGIKNRKKKVLFVCNRGGHLSELLALSPLFEHYESLLVTDKAETTKKINIDIPIKYITSFRRLRKNPILTTLYFIINLFQYIFLYIKFKPKAIITTGANMAVLICYIGKLFNARIIFIETKAKVYSKSKTGKILEPIADLIIVQWPEMLKQYKKSVYWGTT